MKIIGDKKIVRPSPAFIIFSLNPLVDLKPLIQPNTQTRNSVTAEALDHVLLRGEIPTLITRWQQ